MKNLRANVARVKNNREKRNSKELQLMINDNFEAKESMTQDISPHHRRKLWVLERSNVHRNFTQSYNNFNVTAVYNREINESLLSNALHNLILKRSILASNAFRSASSSTADDYTLNYKNFSIHPVDNISFDSVVSWGEIESIDVQFLHNLELVKIPVNSANLPLWRIHVNRCQDDGKLYISFLCDHTTFDGSSAHLFHQDLLNELSALDDGANGAIEVRKSIFNYDEDFEKLSPLLPLPQPVHALYQPTLWQKITAILKALSPSWLTKFAKSFLIPGNPNLWKHPTFTYNLASTPIPKTDYRLIKFSQYESEKIIQKCRQFKITFTPLLYRVGISALEDSVFKAVSPQTKFSTVPSIVIDGRRFFPGFADAIRYQNVVGCFNPLLGPQHSFYVQNGENHSTVSTSFLKSVSSLTKRLHQNIKGTTSFSMIGLLRWTNLAQYSKESGLSNEKLTLEVSNLGLRNYQSGNWKVTDLIFSQSVGTSLYFGLSVVSTVEGGLNVVVGYNDKFNELQGDPVDDFTHLLKERLIKFSELE